MATRTRNMRQGFARFIVTVIVVVTLGISSFASGQVASDKATARELARSGIRKLREGDAQAAVDDLKRAQALYEAPTHLLYLGRASTQLGHLVEAAEYYRALGRMDLEEGSSRLFRESQNAGAAELAEILPRMAHLSVTVLPAELEDLEVKVDDEPLSLATLSVERASNPGRHLIEARAPGYQPFTVEIDLAEGESRAMDIILQVEQTRSIKDKKTKVSPPPPPPTPQVKGQSGPMGFVLGFRAGALLPLGKLDAETSTSSYFYPGPIGTLSLGFRFLNNFGVKAWTGFGGATPGAEMNARTDAQPLSVTSTNRTITSDIGLAFLVTSNPRKFGVFGELGFLPLHQYRWSIRREETGTPDCQTKAKYTGPALHAGGGLHLPLTRNFTLVPELGFSMGRFKKMRIQGDCQRDGSEPEFPTSGSDDATIANRALHLQIFFGVGGDFHFGDSLFQ